MKRRLEVGLTAVLVALGIALGACATYRPEENACGSAHADYIVRAESLEQCRETIGCQITAEDLRGLNQATAEVVALCPVETSK